MSKTSQAFPVTPIRTLLSPKIRIMVTDEITTEARIVGAIQRLTPRQSKTLRRIKEVGTDGFLEIVPTQPAEVNLEVERIAFDRRRLPRAFGRNFESIQSQRFPFNISVQEFGSRGKKDVGVASTGNFDTVGISLYEDCWIADYGVTYSQDDYVVAETATIWATRMSMYYSNALWEEVTDATTMDQAQEDVDFGIDLGNMDTVGWNSDFWFGANSDLFARQTGQSMGTNAADILDGIASIENV